MEAIKDEIRNFAELKQGVLYKLYGKSKVAIENQELIRIAYGKNPGFSFASQYLSLFFHPLDYYSILGLDPAKSITEKDVKDTFKKLAKIYHPDKNPDAPDKKAKEIRFKLIIEAKDALLKKLGSGKEASSISRDNLSLTNYLGNISKLFEEYANSENEVVPKEEKNDTLYHDLKNELNTENNEVSKMILNEIKQEEQELAEDIYEEVPEMESNTDNPQNTEQNKSYLGPYFEEMRLLESMIDGWEEKKILVLGAGHEPEEFSLPVILAQLGAKVTAIDVNYRGPSEYKNCQYYRASADRVDAMFPDEDFDIVISTAMFGAPFTNWAIRQYSLRPLDENFKDKIRELELDVLARLLKLTKKGGIHFHYNRDLNPQSWNFGEEDLKQIGYESAFHPEDLLNSRGIWFIKK
ncbi:hypothetical protein FJZ33_12540 [Candidatus Poribacteria bacterium]|nr:hypothetical protein [Candidatus Poribacteria bacterium]